MLCLVFYIYFEYLVMLIEYFWNVVLVVRGDAFLMRGIEGEMVVNVNCV